MRSTLFAFLMLPFWAASAWGADCDCSQFSGSCRASGSIAGQTLTIRSSANQCSMVTFSINGEPGTLTVSGGSGSTSYLATSLRQPQLSIHSCSVCTDNSRVEKWRAEVRSFAECNLRCINEVEAAAPGCRGNFDCTMELNRRLANFCGCR